MNKAMNIIIATLCVGAVASSQSFAQFPGQPGQLQQPSVSPYFNLLRNGSNRNSTALNYYGLVQPQVMGMSNFGNLQTQLNTTSANSATSGGDLTTGHSFGFFTHRSYYMNFGGGGSAGIGGAGGVGGGARNMGSSGPPSGASRPSGR